VGNSGVSICCLDDAKKLYSGFDLTRPTTSVSMTINGPAPMLLGFFMNAAIDQNCEKYIRANGLEEDPGGGERQSQLSHRARSRQQRRS
jgi:methylmalonyl-CoA mutase